MTSAISSPIDASPAEIAATSATRPFASDWFAHLLKCREHLSARLFDAFAQFHWVMARGDQSVSFVQDVVGQHRYGRGTVASDFVHLAGGLFDEVGPDFVAERLVIGFGQFMPSATVTPSCEMVGAPWDFCITTLRPLGPIVTFTAS